jgi:hypothetical protein
MECPKCGHINPDTAMKCEKCWIHLEWAREHWEGERRRVELQKRRKPFTSLGLFVIFVVVGMVAGVIYLINVVTDTRSDLPLTLLLAICALSVGLYGLLWELRSPRSSQNVFRRSSTTTQVMILSRHTETHTWEPENGGTVTRTTYYAIFHFDAVRPGRAVEQVTLKAKVSKKLYDRLLTGTKLTVRYASEDPCVALFEGELGFTWFT